MGIPGVGVQILNYRTEGVEMEAQVFENYLRKVRELVSQQQDNLQADNRDIICLIEKEQEASAGNSSDEAFLQGEKNFFNGQYELSLKYYLEAKEIPCFQFFCYRASCLVSYERGQQEKAISYAQKALRLDPQDPIIRQIYASLQSADYEKENVHTHNQEELSLEEASCEQESVLINDDQCENLQPQEYALQTAEMNETVQNCIQKSCSGSSSISMPEANFSNKHPAFEGTPKLSCGLEITQRLPSVIISENAHGLEQRIRFFQNHQAESMQNYLQQSEKNSKLTENALYVLNGWPAHAQKSFLFTEESRRSSGGHYLRWNGKGIAINPGPGFLENFHRQGLCIRDIDFVIVTRNNREAYSDVRAISELNHQLNRIAPDRQILHYYLHQRVCQELAPFLKPSFKQARNTVHKLEMYLDSPDVEKVDLEEGIALHYFQTTMPGILNNCSQNSDEHAFNNSSLGIRLELTNDAKKLKIGYLSGLAWSPLIAHHLGHCDLMLAAFGNTNSSDYSKLGYNEDSLGYYGISTLLEELAPRLMLLTEFGGREGDIRIEVVKKMRSEHIHSTSQLSTVLLAADVGLVIDLNNLNVKCSISEASVAPKDVSVVASSESFGHLRYLSSRYCA